MINKGHYHFIGIGGIGMSALAHILLEKGMKVSGSDLAISSVIQELQLKGAHIFIGHNPENITAFATVIYSSAVSQENPEMKRARREGFTLLHRAELLQSVMENSSSLLVTGTHGKTTTASLLAHLFVETDLCPSYAVGGMVASLRGNGGYGKGDYFIAEADESDGSFLKYTPFGSIITNIDNDHLDYWGDLENMVLGFQKFINGVHSAEHLFWCGDDALLRSINRRGYSYGFGLKNDLVIHDFRQEGWRNIFDISFLEKKYLEVAIPLIGGYNVLNAAAVFGLGIKSGLSEEQIRKAFLSFQGTSRRAEFKGEQGGVSVYDDYGHHPTEIFATLRAVKQAIGMQKLVVAFQPHRYSRVRDCLNEFGAAFEKADALIVTDIYSAGEIPIPGITPSAVVGKIKEKSSMAICYVSREKISEFLVNHLNRGDVLLTMGAGDITKVGPEVLNLKLYET